MDDRGDNTQKLWKGNKKRANLYVSFYGKRETLNIWKDVVRVLGVPGHICIKVNQKMDSFIIEGCDAKGPLAFKVPDNFLLDNNVMLRVVSRSFIFGLMNMNGMDLDQTYRIEGNYLEKQNVVVFNMADKELYNPEHNAE